MNKILPLKENIKKVNAWEVISIGGKLYLKLFTQIIDAD